MKNKNDQIEEILNNFDFEIVFSVMNHLRWERYFGKDFEGRDIYELPKMSAIILDARSRLSKCYDEYYEKAVAENQDYFISSGGFVATINGSGWLRLEFVVAEWSYEDDEEIRKSKSIIR